MSDAMCVSRIVRKTRSNPAASACRAPFLVASSSRMRSKISTFESTPMPIVRMKPGDARQRHDGADVAHEAEQNDQVQRDGQDRVDAGQLVVRRA